MGHPDGPITTWANVQLSATSMIATNGVRTQRWDLTPEVFVALVDWIELAGADPSHEPQRVPGRLRLPRFEL